MIRVILRIWSLLLISVVSSYGQQIIVNETIGEVSLNNNKWHYEDYQGLSDPTLIPEESWVFFKKPPNFALNRAVHWFKYEIYNESNKNLYRNIYIPYNHIRDISIFLQYSSRAYPLEKVGTKYSYLKNEFDSPAHIKKITLRAKSKTVIYIRFDHKFLPLRASVFLLDEDTTMNTIKNSNSILWAWKGSYIFASIIAFILFFYHRSKLFIDYFMFNTGVAIFVISHTGFYFFFKEKDTSENIISIVFLGTSIVGLYGPRFMNGISEFRSRQPKLWRFMTVLAIIMWVFFFATLIPSVKYSIYGLIMNSYYMLGTTLIFFGVIYSLTQNVLKGKRRAWIAFVIYSIYVLVTFLDVLLPNWGVMGDSKYIYNTLLISSFFETATFLMLMIYESFSVLKDRSNLLKRQKENQEKLLSSILRARAAERKSVGNELENITNNKMPVLVNDLDDFKDAKKLVLETTELLNGITAGMIRSGYNGIDFKERVVKLCAVSSSRNLKIKSVFNKWPKKIDENISYNLLSVIQELISNLLKHSNSTAATLEFENEDNSYVIFKYYNNGDGFNVKKNIRNGIGLRNIIDRIKRLNGKIEIISNEDDEGTRVIAKIPLNNTYVQA